MKSYEEMAQSVLCRARAERAVRRRKRNCIAVVLACVCCAVLTVTAGVGALSRGQVTLRGTKPSEIVENPVTQPTDTTSNNIYQDSPEVTLLHCIGDTEVVQMREGIRVPYRALVRVRDITGVDDKEFAAVLEQEQACIDELFSEYPRDALNSWGRYRGENVLITTISAGGFRLRLEKASAVRGISVSVTEMGYMVLVPELENGYGSASGKRSIDLDRAAIRGICGDAAGEIDFLWSISPKAAQIIKSNPSVKLSELRDTVTVTVTYEDGGEETLIVDMLVSDSGEIFAVHRGTMMDA